MWVVGIGALRCGSDHATRAAMCQIDRVGLAMRKLIILEQRLARGVTQP